ncbi:hypothetical protein CPB83DRAFT_864556 [Crepidotus variabilis]|uniref:RxLR effector protein n=1 Tax=Crepidotus variabilis TaxID=179855 RepID=A0A9P6E4F4_9AGAR|nr:hypothetical protein CPB83DRAFT_864556 [Crepidotus variabilis]
MVKVASTLFFTALIAAPAFAAVINAEHLQGREVTDQALFGRDLSETEATEYVRELGDLYTRMPEEDTDLLVRDLETDLEARSPNKAKNFFKKLWGGIKKVGSIFLRENEAEQLDEVAAREFDDEVEARDFDEPEFEARDFEDEEEMAAREYDDDLLERDFEIDEDLMERDVSDLEELD